MMKLGCRTYPTLQLHSHVAALRASRTLLRCQAAGPRLDNSSKRLNYSGGKLVERIAAAIEIDDSVHRFETVAGRSAMLGFVSAAAAEFVLPAGGLFGGWSGEQLSAFSSIALFAVTCSALLAVASKRRSGIRLREAVFASLTALSRSAGSLSLTSVDEAVDSVFSSVFTDDLIRDYIEDKYI